MPYVILIHAPLLFFHILNGVVLLFSLTDVFGSLDKRLENLRKATDYFIDFIN